MRGGRRWGVGTEDTDLGTLLNVLEVIERERQDADIPGWQLGDKAFKVSGIFKPTINRTGW